MRRGSAHRTDLPITGPQQLLYAQLTGNGPARDLLDRMTREREAFRRSWLVDEILAINSPDGSHEYTRGLTPVWIERSLAAGWWGGIGNRWIRTKGIYLSILATEERNARSRLILRILESFADRGEWITHSLAARGPLVSSREGPGRAGQTRGSGGTAGRLSARTLEPAPVPNPSRAGPRRCGAEPVRASPRTLRTGSTGLPGPERDSDCSEYAL